MAGALTRGAAAEARVLSRYAAAVRPDEMLVVDGSVLASPETLAARLVPLNWSRDW
jgi:hypothetical protein